MSRERRACRDDRIWTPWRWPIDMPATVQEQGLCALEIRVVDLSLTGCRLWAGYRLIPGRAARIAIDDFAPFRGRVVWAENWYAAIHFDQVIHTSVLTHLVARHPPNSSAPSGHEMIDRWT